MAEREVLKWAESNLGLVSREAAQRHRLTKEQTKYRVKKGRWHKQLPSVFRVGGVAESWALDVKAAVLWAEKESDVVRDPRIFVSHATAARHFGFPGYKRTRLVELTMQRHLRLASRLIVHQTKKKVLEDWETREALHFHVTSPARTLMDLANQLPLWRLRDCIDHCLRTKLTTVEELQRMVVHGRGRPGILKLRDLVIARSEDNGPSESELEARAFHVIERFNLPRPSGQSEVHTTRGRVRRIDFLYEAEKVAVECDGYAWHSDISSFEQDRTRQNELMERGFLILRWTWKSLSETPELLAEQLLHCLRTRR